MLSCARLVYYLVFTANDVNFANDGNCTALLRWSSLYGRCGNVWIGYKEALHAFGISYYGSDWQCISRFDGLDICVVKYGQDVGASYGGR